MKTTILWLSLIFAFSITGKGQEYKVSYIAYKSDVKSQKEGFATSIPIFKNSILKIADNGNIINVTKLTDNIFKNYVNKLTWNRKNAVYVSDIVDTNGLSYSLMADVNKGATIITLTAFVKNETKGKVIDCITVLYKPSK
ncbi:hypothetical protein [Pedobacter hartonius]|uniref:Uncharacterized protein n=1 Tax=Pedobacter hartonius TaxID=425514 RepID=A0A1H3Z2C6_9SPHI|nr:hypothetical protein [Pedobacter hartonius]SEA17810.1 hypothetical protein SAMN05443550_102211 [Pedobacter hartonius]